MKKVLEKRLIKKYPELLQGLYWGIECEDGWYWLLENFLDAIQTYLQDENVPLRRIEQIKQKFGFLRVYFTPKADTFITGILCATVLLSSKACESCGTFKQVKLRKFNDGYLQTLCSECFAKKRKGEK